MTETHHPIFRSHYLRQWREQHGLSLGDMARQTPFGKSTLSRIETDKRPYYTAILEAYARVIGCKPYHLLVPPTGPEELFTIIDAILAEENVAQRATAVDVLKPITKILLKEQ